MIDNLINKLSAQEKEFLEQDIFAPYIKGGSYVSVRLNGVVYRLKTSKFKADGFGVFKARDANNADFLREAELFEKDEYLSLLPKTDVVLVHNVGRWLAYPSHSNSFRHQFGLEPKLFAVLCADNVEPMDTAEVRFDGSNFWFDSVKITDNAEKIDSLRERLKNQNYTITKNIVSGLTPEEEKAFNYAVEFHRQANMTNLERRLHNELNKFGASLDDFIERGNNVSVQWKDKRTNSTYTSVLNKDTLGVVTAGICLSGGDRVFDMQSLVGVCRQAKRRGSTVHVGEGGMEDDRYWEMYGDE